MTTLRTLSTIAALGCLLALSACDTTGLDDSASGPSALGKPDKTPVCHYNAAQDAYYRLDVSGGGLDAHLDHGDVLFSADLTDDDPSDGDLHCITQEQSNDVCTDKILFRTYTDGGANLDVFEINADGSEQIRITDDPRHDSEGELSPDGRKIAFESDRDGVVDIYVMDIDGSNVTRLTDAPGIDSDPTWTPDGRIVFQTQRDDPQFELYIMNSDGSDQTRLTYTDDQNDSNADVSPDGSQIVFEKEADSGHEIFVMNLDGSNVMQITTEGGGGARFSPDGSKIAFHNDFDIYVMNADGSNVTNITNHAEGDLFPMWSPDGSEIAFASDRDGVYSVYLMSADGSNPVPITDTEYGAYTTDWGRLCE